MFSLVGAHIILLKRVIAWNLYTDAHVFVLPIRVSCTHVRYNVRRKRESNRINSRQDHEYSYEMVSVSALTNQIAYFEK